MFGFIEIKHLLTCAISPLLDVLNYFLHITSNFQNKYLLNPFLTNVPLMDKPGSWFFTSKMFEKHLWKIDILSKDAGH